MISTENKLAIGAGISGGLGLLALALPHITPVEWSFFHQNATGFYISGGVLLGLSALSLYARSTLISDSEKPGNQNTFPVTLIPFDLRSRQADVQRLQRHPRGRQWRLW